MIDFEKEERNNKVLFFTIALAACFLIVYSFYYHRNEPHWYDKKYVEIIKTKHK